MEDEIFKEKSWPLWFDIGTFLQGEKAMLDRHLTDFSAGFGLNHGGRDVVQGDVIPDWYAQETFALQRKQQKAQGTANIGGNSVQLDPDTGNLTIIGQSGNVRFQKSDLIALVALIMAGPADPMPVQGTAQASAPVDDRPIVVQRMKENKARMDFAIRQMKKLADKARR